MHPRKVPWLLLVLPLVLGFGGCGGEQAGPPQIVPAEELASTIPAKIGRWEIGVNTPQTLQSANGGPLTRTAGSLYFEGRPQVSFELIDCLEAPELQSAVRTYLEAKHEYYRRFTAQGFPAVEVRSLKPLATNLEIWVADRFWLKLGGEGLTPEVMTEVLAGFDLARIAKLAR
jgi:hypothetical protein